MKIASLAACGMLMAGCVDYGPAVTSDRVLAHQYAARNVHGVLPGAEAQIVADNYRRNIGAHPADTMPDDTAPKP